jgi:hypothetical protein
MAGSVTGGSDVNGTLPSLDRAGLDAESGSDRSPWPGLGITLADADPVAAAGMTVVSRGGAFDPATGHGTGSMTMVRRPRHHPALDGGPRHRWVRR